MLEKQTSDPFIFVESADVEFCFIVFEPELSLIKEAKGPHFSSIEYQRSSVSNVSNDKLIRILQIKSALKKKQSQQW